MEGKFERDVENRRSRQRDKQPYSGAAPAQVQEDEKGEESGHHEAIATKVGNGEHEPRHGWGRELMDVCADREVKGSRALIDNVVRNPGEQKQREHSRNEARGRDSFHESNRLGRSFEFRKSLIGRAHGELFEHKEATRYEKRCRR